jgi:TatD DNase family protein
MIDTHSHLYLEEFREDRQGMFNRAREAGVTRVYLPAINSESHEAMMETAAVSDGFCVPMMGLHPCYVETDFTKELELVEQWLQREKFAAIGEVGLDFYHSVEYREQQVEVFRLQIELALQYDLPIVIHSRSSLDECIKMIAEHGKGKVSGIFHCFGGDERQAKKIIDMGFMLGIGGVVTYKNAGLATLVAQLPLESMVLETDAPYLTPVPFRGKRNETAYIRYVAEKVACLKGIDFEEVDEITTQNAKKIFRF